ncbi:MAG: hypothetical protein ACETWG_00400 [Candidatus Neomarinimicrobiota bacterium]
MNPLPNRLHPALLTLVALLIGGCLATRLTDFTEETRQRHKITEDELQRIQFYNSHTIILTPADEVRNPPTPEQRRKQPLDTRHLDRVVIKRHTPGIVVAAGSNWLNVSFEPGKWLRFIRLPSGRYKLKATTVNYGGRQYHAEYLSRHFRRGPAALLVPKSLKPITRFRSQKVEGQRIP